LFQEPGVTVLIFHLATGLALVGFVGGGSRLQGFLGPLPGSPGLTLNAVDLTELNLPGFVEISDGGLSPLGTDRLEIVRDRLLIDPHVLADLALRPTLQIQIRLNLASLKDG
jgi:hypothetical protein